MKDKNYNSSEKNKKVNVKFFKRFSEYEEKFDSKTAFLGSDFKLIKQEEWDLNHLPNEKEVLPTIVKDERGSLYLRLIGVFVYEPNTIVYYEITNYDLLHYQLFPSELPTDNLPF